MNLNKPESGPMVSKPQIEDVKGLSRRRKGHIYGCKVGKHIAKQISRVPWLKPTARENGIMTIEFAIIGIPPQHSQHI